MTKRSQALPGSRSRALLVGAPLKEIGLASLGAALVVWGLGAWISTAAALAALTLGTTAAIAVAAYVVSRRADLAADRIEARLTLDQLQRGVHDWRLATPFSAPPELLLRAAQELTRSKPRTVLELGAGVSTLILARIIRNQKLPCRLVSVDHDADYLATIAEEVEREGLDEIVTLLHAPLEPIGLDGFDGLWYRRETIFKEANEVGLLIVDGPPKRHGANIRYPALPVLAERLTPGALVLLDDARRRPEREALRRWSRQFPEAESSFESVGHGLGLLRMPKDGER